MFLHSVTTPSPDSPGGFPVHSRRDDNPATVCVLHCSCLERCSLQCEVITQNERHPLVAQEENYMVFNSKLRRVHLNRGVVKWSVYRLEHKVTTFTCSTHDWLMASRRICQPRVLSPSSASSLRGDVQTTCITPRSTGPAAKPKFPSAERLGWFLFLEGKDPCVVRIPMQERRRIWSRTERQSERLRRIFFLFVRDSTCSTL